MTNPAYVNLIKVVAASVFGVFSPLLTAGAESPPRPAYAERVSEAGIAETFATFIRTWEWVVSDLHSADAQCEVVFRELATGEGARWIKPKVVTSNSNDLAFSRLKACDIPIDERTNRSRAELEPSDARTWFVTPRSVGDRGFRLYELSLPGSRPNYWTVIYGEYDEQKLVLNSFFDGYWTLRAKDCRMVGGVTVQRSLALDANHPSTMRDFSHGIFNSSDGVFVIVGTEQVGGRYSPDALRRIAAWKLEESGAFRQKCIWKPAGLSTRHVHSNRDGLRGKSCNSLCLQGSNVSNTTYRLQQFEV